MNDRVDLHAHSTASDGTLSPKELARLGKKIGLRALAITDHDTADGIEEFMKEADAEGLEGVPGMETTLHIEGCDVHMICLYFDKEEPSMASALADMKKSRAERNEKMVEKLRDEGFPVSMEQLRDICSGEISRGHIASILMKAGYGDSPKEIIAKYLSPGTAGYVSRRTPEPKKLIDTVHRAGGVTIIAHLHQIDPADEEHGIAISKMLLDAGADGLETMHSEYDEHWRRVTEGIARECHKLRSGGSDFHGSIKPGLNLGDGYGGLYVPYGFLEEIKKACGAYRGRKG